MIDVTTNESNCAMSKHPQHCEIIYLEARSTFTNGSSASLIKCAKGFNLHGTRDCLTHANKENLSCA